MVDFRFLVHFNKCVFHISFFFFFFFFARARFFQISMESKTKIRLGSPLPFKLNPFLAANSILHLRSLSLWSNFWQILSRQRAWKIFVWHQTAFAWKVKLLSNTFAWVQNSLFFPSLICQKKQLTRILDHSLKSLILRPQFLQWKMQKFRQNLSDGVVVTVARNLHPFGNKFVPVIYFVLWGPKKN